MSDMDILEEEPRISNDNAEIAIRDDEDDEDDDGNDLSEDCGEEHGCLGKDMITKGKCLLKADHTTQHYCFLCAGWF